MFLQGAIFYLFAAVLVFSALRVVTARNPVHSVMFLILAFFNAAGLFIMLGAEFVGMILVIVYVGAVAVLFLFVVMMLDIDFASLRQKASGYVPLGIFVGGVLLLEIFLVFSGWYSPMSPDGMASLEANPLSNTEQIGAVLYTDYIFAFQMAGLVLFVAMIGAIVLTLRHQPGVKRQKVADQQARKVEDSVEVVKVTTGTGI